MSVAVVPDPIVFLPGRGEALDRADRVDPARYALTRNYLNGDATRLSPYVTHGVITVPELIARIHARSALGWDDKLAFEFGWREYFHHVWARLGEDIWCEPHPPPSRDEQGYAHDVPDDIRTATTGVAIIDQQVRDLYRTGYLHNHARMWIASYVVHIRKVSWAAGARWMYAHLLDGDIASNTLSWQWVAGTWTGKPYLFNADNVARYARGAPGTDCSGSVIDTTYEALDAMARSSKSVASRSAAPRNAQAAAEPELMCAPPAPPGGSPSQIAPNAVWVMHPWSLHLPDDRAAVGVINTDFHARYPWSPLRWQFVMPVMQSRCQTVLVGSTDQLAAALCKPLGAQPWAAINTLNPGYIDLLARVAPNALMAPRAYANPTLLKRSFTSFWNSVRRDEFPV
jgi:deoxyribodipyrimidine photo-lyase